MGKARSLWLRASGSANNYILKNQLQKADVDFIFLLCREKPLHGPWFHVMRYCKFPCYLKLLEAFQRIVWRHLFHNMVRDLPRYILRNSFLST